MSSDTVKETAANLMEAWGILADKEYFLYCEKGREVQYLSVKLPEPIKAPVTDRATWMRRMFM